MADSKLWGTFGEIPFEFWTSPEYRSVTIDKSASYREYRRIITRQPNGQLSGQKPIKEIDGLSLDKVSFSCKISSTLLQSLSVNVLESLALAAGAGPLVGSALGDLEDDERFYVDVQDFVDTLDEVQATQDPQPLTIGSIYIGMFTLDDFSQNPKHKPDGTLIHNVIKLSMTEWVEK